VSVWRPQIASAWSMNCLSFRSYWIHPRFHLFFGGLRFAQSVFVCGVLSTVVCLFVFAAIVFSLFELWIYESPLWYLQAFAESILRCRSINAIFVNMIDIIVVGAFCDSPKVSFVPIRHEHDRTSKTKPVIVCLCRGVCVSNIGMSKSCLCPHFIPITT